MSSGRGFSQVARSYTEMVIAYSSFSMRSMLFATAIDAFVLRRRYMKTRMNQWGLAKDRSTKTTKSETTSLRVDIDIGARRLGREWRWREEKSVELFADHRLDLNHKPNGGKVTTTGRGRGQRQESLPPMV